MQAQALFQRFFKRQPKAALPSQVWLVSDGSHRESLSKALAIRLNISKALLIPAGEVEMAGGLRPWLKSHFPQDDIPWPGLVISAGRDTGKLALTVRSMAPQPPITVHFLEPGHDDDHFDLLILPGYEPAEKARNTLLTTGYPNHIHAAYLQAVMERYNTGDWPAIHTALVALPAPYTAVILGGKHVGGTISPEAARAFALSLNPMIAKHGGSLLISTSKRSESATIDALINALEVPHYLYRYDQDRAQENPYPVLLALADHIIVSGDSVRMCSEACSTGKPVQIWTPPADFQPYASLHQQLYDAGYAQPFNGEFVGKTPEVPLDEMGRIANRVRTLQNMR
ncbi:MAG: mitochondrial fission ELM1 family protein [Hyphomicrobiales bacterium]|nr:mitochondrial fission ELM1 family protein [Rickettsiales bacterium]MCP5361978.1 mitochondrial fission ELM1 family protein [Hyphomicrobiales bacterium]